MKITHNMVHIENGIMTGVRFTSLTEFELVHGRVSAKGSVDSCYLDFGYFMANYVISRNAFYKDCGIHPSEPWRNGRHFEKTTKSTSNGIYRMNQKK